MHAAEWVPVPDPFVDLSDAGGPPADTGPKPNLGAQAWSEATDVRPPEDPDEEDDLCDCRDCRVRVAIGGQ